MYSLQFKEKPCTLMTFTCKYLYYRKGLNIDNRLISTAFKNCVLYENVYMTIVVFYNFSFIETE